MSTTTATTAEATLLDQVRDMTNAVNDLKQSITYITRYSTRGPRPVVTEAKNEVMIRLNEAFGAFEADNTDVIMTVAQGAGAVSTYVNVFENDEDFDLDVENELFADAMVRCWNTLLDIARKG